MKKNHCHVCDSTNIAIMTKDVTFTNRADEMVEIKDYEYSECLDCKQDYVTGEQAKRNEQKIAPLAQW